MDIEYLISPNYDDVLTGVFPQSAHTATLQQAGPFVHHLADYRKAKICDTGLARVSREGQGSCEWTCASSSSTDTSCPDSTNYLSFAPLNHARRASTWASAILAHPRSTEREHSDNEY